MIERALAHEIVTVVGRTGSGKTQLIAKHIGPRHARRITVDLVNECRKLYPHAVTARTLADVVRLLRAFHERSVNQWHIIAALEIRDVGKMIQMLAPTGTQAEFSLAAAWGGIALEIFELDILAPVDRSEPATREAIRSAYARGRHFGLSILAATQRPHQIDRIATAMASHVVTFQMHEPADLQFLERVGGKRFAELSRTGLEPHQSAWYVARTGEILTLTADYKHWTLEQGAPRRELRAP